MTSTFRKTTFRKTWGTLFGVGTAVAALGVVAACQAIDGIHTYAYDNPEASVVYRDGGVVTVVQDGGVKYVGFGDAACDLAKPPGSPDPALVDTSAPNGQYIIAFSRISFTGNASSVVGYDLDGVCTGEQTEAGTGPSSCIPADGGMAPEDTVSSAGEGVDSVLTTGGGKLESFFHGFDLDTLAHTATDIADGTQTAFLVIDEYNFTPNDQSVTVAFGISESVESTGCVNPVPGKQAPHFDGCDKWSVDVSTVVPNDAGFGGNVYKYLSTSAYVNNGVLVAHFDGAINFPVGAIELSPTGTLVVATLQLTDAGADGGADAAVEAGLDGGSGADGSAGNSPILIRVQNGLIQGRLSASSFLSAVGAVGDPLDPTMTSHICPGSPSFSTVQNAVCSGLDVSATLGANGSPVDDGTKPCDGFTFASTFDGVTAFLGAPVAGSNHDPACGADANTACP